MADPGWALQVAIKDALSAALAPVAVHDSVPADAAYPYAVLEAEISAPSDSFSQRRENRFFYVSVWSTYRGQKEVKEMIGQIDAALHERRLTLETGRLVNIRTDRTQTIRDADGLTFQGQVVLRAITEH